MHGYIQKKIRCAKWEQPIILSTVHSTKYHVGTKLRNRVYIFLQYTCMVMHGKLYKTIWLSVSLVYKLRSIPSMSTNSRWFCLIDQSDNNVQKEKPPFIENYWYKWERKGQSTERKRRNSAEDSKSDSVFLILISIKYD